MTRNKIVAARHRRCRELAGRDPDVKVSSCFRTASRRIDGDGLLERSPAVEQRGTVPCGTVPSCFASAGMSLRSVPLFELENLFDGFAEDPGDLQSSTFERTKAPGLDGVYGLAAYADGIGQLLLGHAHFRRVRPGSYSSSATACFRRHSFQRNTARNISSMVSRLCRS